MNALTSKFVALVFILAITSASAQTGGQYVLDWSTIDGGGGTSRGGSYVLTGTIGQPDAAYSAGGSYELLGGFWPGGPLCFVDLLEGDVDFEAVKKALTEIGYDGYVTGELLPFEPGRPEKTAQAMKKIFK